MLILHCHIKKHNLTRCHPLHQRKWAESQYCDSSAPWVIIRREKDSPSQSVLQAENPVSTVISICPLYTRDTLIECTNFMFSFYVKQKKTILNLVPTYFNFCFRTINKKIFHGVQNSIYNKMGCSWVAAYESKVPGPNARHQLSVNP